MTHDEFSAAFKPLRLLKGWPADPKAATDRLEAYWDQFQHADPADFAAGCARAVRQRTFFPTPAELFADCEQAAPRRVWVAPELETVGQGEVVTIPNPFGGAGLTVTVRRVWNWYCDECCDTGWSSAWCGDVATRRQPWLLVVACGRRHDHLPHEWVCPCGCWARNPALIAKRARQAQDARGDRKDAA